MTRRRRPFGRLSRNAPPAAVVIVALLVILFRGWPTGQDAPPAGALSEGVYRVQRVVDGDTLLLANEARVRLIGADTPETHEPKTRIDKIWGPKATEFTQHFVAGGEVRLEFDGPRLDQYRRNLAHVWVGDRMLGEELIRAGLAWAQTQYDYSDEVKGRLLAAEADAKAAGRGIWSE